MNKILVNAVKDLLVTANKGDSIADSLYNLEQAMELAEPGWCVAEELRRRYKTEQHELDDEAA